MNIPETYRNKDWPRKVSKAYAALELKLTQQAAQIDGLQSDTGEMEGFIISGGTPDYDYQGGDTISGGTP